MCRFTDTNAPPPQPASPGLEQLLDDDDFSWFDAIADLPDEPIENGVIDYQADAAVVRSSDSSENVQSDNKPSPSGGYSDTSSYELMDLLFNQQVKQDPAVMMASLQAQYGCTSVAASSAAEQAAGVVAGANGEVKMPVFTYPMAAPSPMQAPVMPQAAAGMMVAPGPSTPAASAVPAAVSMPQVTSVSVPAVNTIRKPGTKIQKSQEEQEAAIERIKQKRRESAQRSRARKNEYMRQLELENLSLKEEIHRLQSMIQAMQRQPCIQPQQLSPQMAL